MLDNDSVEVEWLEVFRGDAHVCEECEGGLRGTDRKSILISEPLNDLELLVEDSDGLVEVVMGAPCRDVVSEARSWGDD